MKGLKRLRLHQKVWFMQRGRMHIGQVSAIYKLDEITTKYLVYCPRSKEKYWVLDSELYPNENELFAMLRDLAIT